MQVNSNRAISILMKLKIFHFFRPLDLPRRRTNGRKHRSESSHDYER